MELEDSLPCSRKSATEPHESNPHKMLESRNAYRILIEWNNGEMSNTESVDSGAVHNREKWAKRKFSADDTKLNTAMFWTNEITEKEQMTIKTKSLDTNFKSKKKAQKLIYKETKGKNCRRTE
jgi:tRNA U34 5-carboxymethylaminomethyl modifying enzyme MnmG/GidA